MKNGKKNFGFLFFIFLGFGVLYYLFTSRYVNFYDSGEFIVAVKTFGISHPPGYPLLPVLFRFIMLFIPVKDFTFKCNLASAFFNVVTITCAGIILLDLKRKFYNKVFEKENSYIDYISVLIGVILFGFFPSIFKSGLRTEVYSLFNLFFILYFLLFLKSIFENIKYAKFAFFIFGMGLIIHPLILLLAPLVIYQFLLLIKAKDIKVIIQSIIYFCLGFLTVLVIPILSSGNPYINFEGVNNFQSFKALIMREGFSRNTFAFGKDLLRKTFILGSALKNLNLGFIPSMIFSVAGAIIVYKKFEKKLFYVLTLFSIFWFYIIIFIFDYQFSFGSTDYEFFFTPFYLIFIIFYAIALWWLIDSIIRKFPKLKVTGQVTGFILVLILIFILKFPAKYNMRDYKYADDYGRNLIRSTSLTTGKKIVIFSFDDNSSFILMYLKVMQDFKDVEIIPITLINSDWFIKQVRLRDPDLVISKYPFITGEWGGLYDFIREFEKQNGDRYDVYTTFNEEVFASPLLFSCGLLYTVSEKINRTGERLNFPDDQLSFKDYKVNESAYPEINELMTFYSNYFFRNSVNYFKQERFQKSEVYINKALEINSDNPYYLYQLGMIKMKQQECRPGLEAFKKHIKFSDEPLNGYLNAMFCTYKLNDEKEFQELYKISFPMYRDDNYYSWRVSFLLFKMGRYEESLELVKNFDADNPMVNLSIGLNLYYLGKVEEAKEIFKTIPDNIKDANADYLIIKEKF